MDEEKFPCFGSHKVILVEGSTEEDSITSWATRMRYAHLFKVISKAGNRAFGWAN